MIELWPSLDRPAQQEMARVYFQSHYGDPVDWALNVGFTPDPWQARVLWSTENIILNCSRQSGKSDTGAHKAAYTASTKDNALVLLISPSLRQSSELFRKVRDVFDRLTTHVELEEDNKLSLQIKHNRSRIVSLPANEATIRGFSAVDLVIIDEASRCSDALYNTLRPMLAISKGQLIVMSTPFGQQGFFYEEWQRSRAMSQRIKPWVSIKITADMCPRIGADFLAEEREALGEWWYKQEYQGAFVETMGQLFTEASIQAALSDDGEPLFDEDPLERLWRHGNSTVRQPASSATFDNDFGELFQQDAA